MADHHCRIEAMRHKTRPLYGTQFHPEAYAEPFLHGKRLLANFAVTVRDFWKNRKRQETIVLVVGRTNVRVRGRFSREDDHVECGGRDAALA